ncbi:hypothetical protein SBA3_1760007 [Candidatus Sulfopaludibacter sp. SbA3]|nr:hypothetical protein SBA3_1760007 [Candidatus Sulfopaludibacter sp. SbA3]
MRRTLKRSGLAVRVDLANFERGIDGAQGEAPRIADLARSHISPWSSFTARRSCGMPRRIN